MNEITEQIFLARLFYLGTLVVICAYIAASTAGMETRIVAVEYEFV